MMPDPERVLPILNESLVEYVVIGGVALVAHGSARSTFYIDLCYKRSKENIARLCRALDPFHPRLRGAPKDLPFRFDTRAVSAA